MNDENNVIFHEEQKFSLWIRIAVLIVMFDAVTLSYLALHEMLTQQQSYETQPIIRHIIVGILLPITIAVLFLMLKLETQVRTDGLYVRLLPIHIRFKRFSPDDLSEFYTRTYHPILEYGGWGIRYGWFWFGKPGKAYNVRGNKGIQLVLKNGKKLLIGSQRPEQLAQAISSVIQNP
ncbi:DUF6141 family protein [Planctomycetota bacterium]